MLGLCALMFVGPFVFAALALVVTGGFIGHGSAFHDLALLAGILALAQVITAAGCAALCRWCFLTAPVQGAALLSGLLVSLALLSAPTFGKLVQGFVVGGGAQVALQDALLRVIVESLISIGLSLFAVMFCVLLVELPLRWAVGDKRFLEDGLFRAVRCVGSLFVLYIGSVLIEEDGISRLLRVLRYVAP